MAGHPSHSNGSHIVSLYIDGELRDAQTMRFQLPLATLGSSRRGQSFHGRLAEMRVWSTDRSAVEIKRDMFKDVADTGAKGTPCPLLPFYNNAPPPPPPVSILFSLTPCLYPMKYVPWKYPMYVPLLIPPLTNHLPPPVVLPPFFVGLMVLMRCAEGHGRRTFDAAGWLHFGKLCHSHWAQVID